MHEKEQNYFEHCSKLHIFKLRNIKIFFYEYLIFSTEISTLWITIMVSEFCKILKKYLYLFTFEFISDWSDSCFVFVWFILKETSPKKLNYM